MRVMSNLPLGINVVEPHEDPEHPGLSPNLKRFVLRPGTNDLSDDDAAIYKAWAEVNGAFLASADDVKGGNTDGRIYEMQEDAPEQEFGFQPALDRAADAMKPDDAAVSDPKPVTAQDQKPAGTIDAPAPAVLTAAAPVKLPATSDASGVSPVVKPAAPAGQAAPASK